MTWGKRPGGGALSSVKQLYRWKRHFIHSVNSGGV